MATSRPFITSCRYLRMILRQHQPAACACASSCYTRFEMRQLGVPLVADVICHPGGRGALLGKKRCFFALDQTFSALIYSEGYRDDREVNDLLRIKDGYGKDHQRHVCIFQRSCVQLSDDEKSALRTMQTIN